MLGLSMIPQIENKKRTRKVRSKFSLAYWAGEYGQTLQVYFYF